MGLLAYNWIPFYERKKVWRFQFYTKPIRSFSAKNRWEWRPKATKKTDLPVLLGHQVHKMVFPVHRLDQGVGGGVMVFALTKQAAAHLSRQVQQHTMEKEYWAVVAGVPEKTTGDFPRFSLSRCGQTEGICCQKGPAGRKKKRFYTIGFKKPFCTKGNLFLL